MAIDLKEVLDEFGFKAEDVEKISIDDIRKHREENVLFRETAHLDKDLEKRIVGKRFGTFSKIQKEAFAELGVEFNDDEIAGKKEEEIFVLGKEKLKSHISELKESSSKSNDDKVNSVTKKYQDLENKFKEVSGLYENTKGLLSQKEQEFQSELKKHKLNTTYKDYKSKISWADDVTKDPTKLEFFDYKVQQMYDFDLDDTEGFIVKDKKTGERIKTKNGSAFETVENILQKEAMEMQMLKLNNGSQGAPQQRQTLPTTPPANNNGQSDVRQTYVQHRI